MTMKKNMKSHKTILFLFTLLIIAILGTLPASYAKAGTDKTSIQEVKKETQDLLHSLKSYTVDQRDTAVQKTKSALNKLDQRIEALETRIHKNWDRMDKAARKKAQASLESLRKQRTQVAKWYDNLKNNTTDGWGHIKQGFSNAYKSLHKSWEKTESEFESEEK